MSKCDLEKLGQKFKAARLRQKISQSELANRIGKDQPSINRLEKGKINPSYLYMVEVCEGLNMNLCDILDS